VKRLLAALLVIAPALAWACSTPCETTESDPAIEFHGGNHVSDTMYETSAWDQAFLHFPPGRRFKLFHGLAAPPTVESYVAFTERPLATENNVSESAGNQVLIEAANAEYVQVRNDTCAEYYLRVVATIPGGVSDAGGGG
jgi:hypothetical protein